MILKMILKSFDFQCDFDFQITTSKVILILNHLYLGDLILILKSSTYDDFAHLWVQGEGSRRLSRQRCFIILTALHLCENFTLDRVLQM